MRNLKKILALVLALVMSLSLVTMANADFSDAADIDYKEAVEVMAKIGVLEGSDGKFDPKGTLTREQAAKILTYVVLGTDKAEKLTAAVAPFADVAANRWSAGAIAYCASEGIIAGIGDGLYNPTGKLTGAAFGKMLLVALGFDADKNGLVGDAWEVNTAKLLVEEDLHINGLVLSNELTREQAAQMALNAVKWSSTPDVYEVRYTTNSKTSYTVVGEFEKQLDAVLYANVLGAYSSGTGYYAEKANAKDTLLKSVFNVTADDADNDDFGRPGTSYTHADWDLFYADDAAVTYTAAVKGGKVYTALGKDEVNVMTYWRNGQNLGDRSSYFVSGNTQDFGANGTALEIYKLADGNYVAVEVQTYVTTIASHTDAVKDSDGDITAKEYITLTAGGNFETTDFTEADEDNNTVVLYTKLYDGTIKSVETAKSEKLMPTWCNTTSFKAAGTTYSYAANKAHTIASSDVSAKADKVVYFDNYGYVIEIADPASAAPEYAYVLDIDSQSELFGTPVYYAKLLYADGTIGTVPTTEADVTKENTIVTYAAGTGANAGKTVLTNAAASYTGSFSVAKNTALLQGATVNNKTVFVVETTDNDSNKVYTVYTGVRAVPAMTTTRIAGITKDGAWTVFYALGATLTTSDSSATDVVYMVKDSAAQAYDVDKGTYYTYTGIVNGVIKTDIEATSGTLGDTIYDSYTTNDKGLVSSTSAMDATGTAIVSVADVTTKASEGVIFMDSTRYIYSDATVVYVVDADNVIAKSSIGALEVGAYTRLVGYTTDGILTLIVAEK